MTAPRDRRLDRTGSNLIYLISSPRSGSTLLQYMLAGHPRIDTLPEPWFMLHFLYGLRTTGLSGEYRAVMAQRGVADYVAATGGGRDLFIDAVRGAALRLYGEALRDSEADLFLDKTPRYYLVAEELRQVFPQARFIFLLRNPLAVLASILQAVNGDWTALRRVYRMHDLITAPRNIARAIDTFDGRIAVVRYEDLVQNADDTLSQLLTRLDLEDVRGLSRYRAVESRVGDSKSVARYDRPVTEYVDRWKRDLRSSSDRQLAASYLDALGEDLLERLGYSYSELRSQLRIDRSQQTPSSRWRLVVITDPELRWWDRVRLSITHSRYMRGIAKTIVRTCYIAVVGCAPRQRTPPRIEAGRMDQPWGGEVPAP